MARSSKWSGIVYEEHATRPQLMRGLGSCRGELSHHPRQGRRQPQDGLSLNAARPLGDVQGSRVPHEMCETLQSLHYRIQWPAVVWRRLL